MPESQYLNEEAENHPDEPEYLNDLRILRRFVQNGSFGYHQSRDVVFQTLKARYPETYSAFGEERRRETLDRCNYSPYIERVGAFPDSEYSKKRLSDLRELRKIMILFKFGYGGYAMGMVYGKLKNSHPEAHEAFEKELEEL
jgi:hypothetical protein